ncbi:PAS domain-containing protein [Leucobacter viscericola]|uniref:PAS domain-containing protein n=1 Tax=Leucobacter viscericola TaxID=2714935 RepID=A0A6G7XD41_9MICO|nr:PAS domain-containing protein [Leucobacter viscericola]QIK62422.1 PAS domain-containing protein [Leucobacter viscericola]
MTTSVQPSGKTHEVEINDVFFSTTDIRGVIEHANEMFVEYSHYSRESLVGSPHNIVRHPDMPSGVFHTMWSELQSGRPFAGHVTNLAADGSSYKVYATVTPLGNGGYLSVRIRPTDSSRALQLDGVYRELLGYENELAGSGLSRRGIAEQGAIKLGEILADAGFDSIAALQRQVLPQEVTKFERRSEGFPHRPKATGSLADMLAAVEQVNTTLGAWSMQQHHLATLSASLREVGEQLQHELEHTSQTTAQISDLAASGIDVGDILTPLGVWSQMQAIIEGYVVDLIGALQLLDENSAETRFRVALAKLHTRMMASFAAELIDGGGARQGDQAAAISLLAQTLKLGLKETSEFTATHRALMVKTVESIAKSTSVLKIPRDLLLDWERNASATSLPPAMQPLASDVTGSITKVGKILADLNRVVDLCSKIDTGDDPADMLQLVAQIEQAVAPFEASAATV